MKQYKHKVTGNIATETSSEKNYRVTSPQNFTIPKWIIENSKEWEEIIVFETPTYVKCVAENMYGSGKVNKIYKVISIRIDAYYILEGETEEANMNRFVPSTKEEYDLQNEPNYVNCYFQYSTIDVTYFISKRVKNSYTLTWTSAAFPDGGSATYDIKHVHDFFKNGTWKIVEKPIEVFKPEYEILIFSNKTNDEFTLNRKDNLYYHSSWITPSVQGCALEEMLTSSLCFITSVKRLSDGIVFNVGDMIEHFTSPTDKGKITKISIINASIIKYILIEFEGKYKGNKIHRFSNSLPVIKHSKLPLFTSEDGVNIYTGDPYWYIFDKNPSEIFHSTSAIPLNRESNIKRFSTKQIAEEYIVNNKVLFTTEDGVGIKKGDEYCYVDEYFGIYNCDKAISTSGTSGFKYFSTRGKAQEYVDMNDIIYSKQQMLKAAKILGWQLPAIESLVHTMNERK